MPFFTIEHVVDYLINHKEQDSMRVEDWKNFKTGEYKLFKEGHVQNIMVSQQGLIFGIKCNCLPETRKTAYINWISILLLLGQMCAMHSVIVLKVEVRMAVVNTLQKHFLLLKIFILLTKKFRHLPMIMMCPAYQTYRLGTNQGKGD